jgi:aspartate kinase
MKFGGTSVADAVHIREVGKIVRERLARKPVVVVSAHSGVTDQLDQLARAAVVGKADIRPLAARHATVLQELGLDPAIHTELLAELETLLRGIALVRELSARTLDLVHSFGERLSVRTVAAHFNAIGMPATALDAFDAGLVTDTNYGRARPLASAEGAIRERLGLVRGVPVISGYIGKDSDGHITTLGRNGSDYSAAIFGNALNVEEIQIWTDVDGVMTADPRVVPEARSIPEMTYEEAGELAYYGGKVLHPATIQPAVAKNIPVRVLNTRRSTSPGTLIERAVPGSPGMVTSITSRRGVAMLNVLSTRMLGQSGFMSRLFEEFGRLEIVIDHIATSEVSVTLTTDARAHLENVQKALADVADVQFERGKATVSIVGRGMRSHSEAAPLALTTLQKAGIAPQLITQSALRTSLSLLLEEAEAGPAVKALHAAFFG